MRVAGHLVVVTVALALSGCTSFAFPSKGQGDAPAALKDRSAMAKLPAGRFTMGWALGEPDEYPPHEVELKAFLVDRTEVTNAAYRACVDAGVCRKASYADDPILGRERHPVVGVTWFDAVRYCRWVDKRLPTEAEWEYAARAPAFSAYPWEGRFVPTHTSARGDADGYPKTAPVGSFDKGVSGHGVYDMAGNAAEWTHDWYLSTWYQETLAESPKGPSAPTGSRVVRGGSWADTDYELRSTARSALDPNFGKNSVGFRCAADPR